MTGQNKAHLLIVDRDKRLRELLRQYLMTRGFLVSVARDETHAARLLAGLEFDLVLLDAQLPAAKAVKEALSTPVVCLAEPGSPAPDGTTVMIKPFEPRALCDTINSLLDRQPPPEVLAPRRLQLGALNFDPESGHLSKAGEPVPLTVTEVKLMRIFAAAPGKTISRAELIARLGREGSHQKARAVDVQITRLRRKLEVDPKNPQYLQTVRGAGYVLAAP